MKVLVTGGAGYIGSALVQELAKRKDIESIVVYDNLSRDNYNLFTDSKKLAEGKVRFEFGDLLDSRKLKKAVKNADVVYHLAAKTSSPNSDLDSHFFEQTNHWGTAELVYAVEESTNVKKFIVASSTAIYGTTTGTEEVNESSEPNPKTFYAVSKMRGESHVQRLFDKTNTVILRLSNVYGHAPALRFDTVINRFMFDGHYKNRISIHGSGNQVRSFVHINKAVDALVQALEKEVPSGIYNVTDKQLSLLDMLDVLKEIYPPMEFILINQHLTPSDLRVSPESNLSKYIAETKSNDLNQELSEFKAHFSFS